MLAGLGALGAWKPRVGEGEAGRGHPALDPGGRGAVFWGGVAGAGGAGRCSGGLERVAPRTD